MTRLSHRKRKRRTKRLMRRRENRAPFRCGKVAVDLWPFTGKIPPFRLRKVKRPKMANVKGKAFVILYDHEGADRHDARAIVTVGFLRWQYRHLLDPEDPSYSEQKFRMYLRLAVERGLGVRPKLERLKDAEREVADLLRAKAVIADLQKETEDGQREGFRGATGATGARARNHTRYRPVRMLVPQGDTMKKPKQEHIVTTYTLANAPKSIRDLVLKHTKTRAS